MPRPTILSAVLSAAVLFAAFLGGLAMMTMELPV